MYYYVPQGRVRVVNINTAVASTAPFINSIRVDVAKSAASQDELQQIVVVQDHDDPAVFILRISAVCNIFVCVFAQNVISN